MVPLRPVSKISPPCESIPVQAAIGERAHHSRCTKEIGEPARQRELAEALLKKVQAYREDRGKPACGSRVTQQTADTAREIKKLHQASSDLELLLTKITWLQLQTNARNFKWGRRCIERHINEEHFYPAAAAIYISSPVFMVRRGACLKMLLIM